MRSARLMSIPGRTAFRSNKVSHSPARRGSLQNYRVWSRRFLHGHRTKQQLRTINYRAGSAVGMPRFAAARVGLAGAYVLGKAGRILALQANSRLSLEPGD